MVALYFLFSSQCHGCQYVHYLSGVFRKCKSWAGTSDSSDPPTIQVGLVRSLFG